MNTGLVIGSVLSTLTVLLGTSSKWFEKDDFVSVEEDKDKEPPKTFTKFRQNHKVLEIDEASFNNLQKHLNNRVIKGLIDDKLITHGEPPYVEGMINPTRVRVKAYKTNEDRVKVVSSQLLVVPYLIGGELLLATMKITHSVINSKSSFQLYFMVPDDILEACPFIEWNLSTVSDIRAKIIVNWLSEIEIVTEVLQQ